MVAFRLRKLANLLDEYERLPEVPETKSLLDPVRDIAAGVSSLVGHALASPRHFARPA